ncbi:MAG: hypothetical protein JJ868_19490 [Shimia sp.]|uniref:hypothetical protein n=1 Tax=Shimia sp. TaxID=1954381 RepID=UPI001B0CCAED|nr:hypothetical protein [Shimia sp.]MBO6899548.1 hypothetical protein [Shimia sp.]
MLSTIQNISVAVVMALSVGPAHAQSVTTDQIVDAIDQMQSMIAHSNGFDDAFGTCDPNDAEQCARLDFIKRNMVQSMDARMRKMIAGCAMVRSTEMANCERRVTWKVEDFSDELADRLGVAPQPNKWQRDIRRLFY